MAAYAGVPVVNALTDEFHPCQVLADLLTIRQHHGRLAGLTLAYLGDGANNMAHSYLLGGALAGLHVRIGAPAGFQPDPAILARAEALAARDRRQRAGHRLGGRRGRRRRRRRHRHLGVDGHRGRRARPGRRSSCPYAVTAELMAAAAPDAIVLHCLPAYRGKEIEADGDRRTAVGGLGRGREPPARAEGVLAFLPILDDAERVTRDRPRMTRRPCR